MNRFSPAWWMAWKPDTCAFVVVVVVVVVLLLLGCCFSSLLLLLCGSLLRLRLRLRLRGDDDPRVVVFFRADRVVTMSVRSRGC
jgi:hypothetical protein